MPASLVLRSTEFITELWDVGILTLVVPDPAFFVVLRIEFLLRSHAKDGVDLNSPRSQVWLGCVSEASKGVAMQISQLVTAVQGILLRSSQDGGACGSF